MRNPGACTVIGLALAVSACVGGGGGGGCSGGGGGGRNSTQSSGPVAPGQVTQLTAFPSDGEVKLVWGLPQSGGIPTAFKIYRAIGGTVPTPSGAPFATVSAATLEYTDSAVSNYVTYTYVSVASNNTGDGPPSNPAEATPRADLPGAPQQLTATAGDRQVDLSWSAPASGGPPTQYRVYRGTTAVLDETWTALGTSLEATASSYRDTEVTNFTTYGYVVRAINLTGEGPPSAPATAMPHNGVPGSPGNLTALPGNGQVELAWRAPADGGDVYQYTVYRGSELPVDLQTWLKFPDLEESQQSFQDNSPENWVTYAYVVTASNPLGSSPPSAPATAMPHNGAPGTPQNLAATGGDRQVTLTWDPPLGGGDVFEYSVTRCELADCTGWTPVATVQAPATSARDTDGALVNFTTYQYRVAAVNPIGTSAAATATAMPNNGAPGAPRNLGTAAAMGSITLSWQAPETGGDVYEYRIFRSTSPAVNTAGEPLAVTGPGATGYTDTAVTDFNTYYYAIAAWNPVGQGAPTPAVGEMAGAAPGAPEAATATSGDAAVTLAWSAPTSGGPVSSYTVYRGTTPGAATGGTSIVTTTDVRITDRSVANYQAYYYAVTATNPKGEGPASVEVFAYPKDGSQPVPADPPPAVGTGDHLGRSVAISGDYAVIGAPMTDDGTVSNAGAAYLYARATDGAWELRQTLTRPAGANDPVTSAQFGHAVAVGGDIIAVGAPLDPYPGTADTNGGRVYVYRRQSGGQWQQETILGTNMAGTTETHADHFGYAVATDGMRLIVGAYRDSPVVLDNGCRDNAGSARIYVLGKWTAPVQLQPSGLCQPFFGTGSTRHGNFGFSVGISGDNALVGAANDSTGNVNDGSGAIYFFKRTPGTETWIQAAKIKTNISSSHFGWSVALSGTWAIAGSPYESCPAGTCGSTQLAEAGAVRVYELASGTWTLRATLRSPDPLASEHFGQAVALTGTSAYIAAGTLGGSRARRRIYRCDRSGSDWSCSTFVPLSSEGDMSNDAPLSGLRGGTGSDAFDVRHGHAVATDGTNIAVGAPFADVGTSLSDNSGALFFY